MADAGGHAAGLVALATAILGSPMAQAAVGGAGLVVTRAEIEGGRLLVSGRANVPNASVSIVGTTIQTKSRSDRSFGFSVVYRPKDCKIRLQTLAGRLEVMLAAIQFESDQPLNQSRVLLHATGDTGPANGRFLADVFCFGPPKAPTGAVAGSPPAVRTIR